MNTNVKENSNSSVPKWFKIMNAIILTLVISCSTYIAANEIGSSHERTSGAGDIWWASAPEIDQSYRSIVEKTEKKSMSN